jgi:RNA polymerase sigma factor (sigma-70 family)
MNDERLARRAAAGDKAAFEAIFRRYHQDLYRYCLATVGNPQDAQDALQSTMVKAMQALPGEERTIKLKPWLYRVARNEAVETLRKRRDSIELEPEPVAVGSEIAETAAARERLRQLFADLEELPERQRSALVMRELAGLDFAEIGAAFETTPAVARQTLYEARLSLQQMAEGREMSCEAVMRALSDEDGRVTRRRDLRAHLRGCASCRAFRDGIAERRGEFAAIAPHPVALSAGLLQALAGEHASGLGAAGAAPTAGAATASGAGAGGAGGGLAGTIGVGVGKTAATATIAKSAATVAVVAAVGVSAAERGGVIDLPVTGGDGKTAKRILKQGTPVTRGLRSAAAAATPGTPAAAERSADAASSAKPASGRQGEKDKEWSVVQSNSRQAEKQAKGPRQRGRPSRPASANDGAKRGQAHEKLPGEQHGQPQGSSRSQGTAAEHKAPQANSTPDGNATGKTMPAPKAAEPPKSKGAALTPPPPPATVTETVESAKKHSGPKSGAKEAESSEP